MMDYTEGAIDVPAEALRRAHLEHFGHPVKGNSQFTAKNFDDSFGDRRYYVLRRSKLIALIENETEALPWIEDVCDCDSKTIVFGADLIKAARRFGWKRGAGAFDLWYTSKTLGLPHVNRLDGYHSAPLVWTVDDDGERFQPVIIQPKTIYNNDVISDAQIQDPKDEIKFYVFASSIA